MSQKLKKAMWAFSDAFGYFPNTPAEVDFDDRVYIDLLERSIRDKVDYTADFPGLSPDEKIERAKPHEQGIIYD